MKTPVAKVLMIIATFAFVCSVCITVVWQRQLLDEAMDVAREAIKQRDEWRDLTYKFANEGLVRARPMDVGGDMKMGCCRVVDGACQVDLVLPQQWLVDPSNGAWCRPSAQRTREP